MVKGAMMEIAIRASQCSCERAIPVEPGTNYTHVNPPLFAFTPLSFCASLLSCNDKRLYCGRKASSTTRRDSAADASGGYSQEQADSATEYKDQGPGGRCQWGMGDERLGTGSGMEQRQAKRRKHYCTRRNERNRKKQAGYVLSSHATDGAMRQA